MTLKQLEQKMETARKYGKAQIDDCVLYYFSEGNKYFSLQHFDGTYWQTVTTGYSIKQFDFLVD